MKQLFIQSHCVSGTLPSARDVDRSGKTPLPSHCRVEMQINMYTPMATIQSAIQSKIHFAKGAQGRPQRGSDSELTFLIIKFIGITLVNSII